MSNKRRRDLTRFQWHAHDEDKPSATVRMRHTDFSLDDAGPASLRTTLIPTAPSPSRRRVDSDPVYQEDYLLTQLYDSQVEFGLGDMEVDTGLEQEEAAVLEDEGVDPQYQRHLEDNELGTGKTRRKRTVEVRGLLFHSNVCSSSFSIQDNPLRKWLDERDSYMLELLRRDGRGGADAHCAQCHAAAATIRCIDCHGGRMVCNDCTVSTHGTTPLHRVEVCIFFNLSLYVIAQALCTTLEVEWAAL